jgi:hypothetical protein
VCVCESERCYLTSAQLHHPTSGTNQLFRAKVTSEQYINIMKNPRAHTNQGYRRKADRPTGIIINQEDDNDDEFDHLRHDESHTRKDIEMEDTDVTRTTVSTTYYAKDVKYDFKKQGHQNRRDQMSKLQQSAEYSLWKEANKKEYAVIHAKFYVSVPKIMHNRPQPTAASGGFKRRSKNIDPLPLPQQSTVIDIKAAEKATLGTNYRAIGPPQTISRSSVRMERINGLTDDKDWKGEPVFEQKLYYRAESVVTGQDFGEDLDDEMSDDENEGVLQVPSINDYKKEKMDQVQQYHSELDMYVVREEAEQRLRNVKNKIHLSESIEDVDESVRLFYTDLIHRQAVGSTQFCI